jgi:cell division protein FtsN
MSASAANQARDPLRRSDTRVQVGAYPTRSQAELAQAALGARGIQSRLEADDAGGAYPFVLAGAARLLVDAADVVAALAALSSSPKPN